MDQCAIETGMPAESGFDEVLDELEGDLYWIRFFVRPCCPAPALEEAYGMLNRLIAEVGQREDFTPEQRERLSAVIEARKQWYATSGLCRGSRA